MNKFIFIVSIFLFNNMDYSNSIIDNKIGNFSGNCFMRFTNLGKKHIGKINDNLLLLKNPIKKVGVG